MLNAAVRKNSIPIFGRPHKENVLVLEAFLFRTAPDDLDALLMAIRLNLDGFITPRGITRNSK